MDQKAFRSLMRCSSSRRFIDKAELYEEIFNSEAEFVDFSVHGGVLRERGSMDRSGSLEMFVDDATNYKADITGMGASRSRADGRGFEPPECRYGTEIFNEEGSGEFILDKEWYDRNEAKAIDDCMNGLNVEDEGIEQPSLLKYKEELDTSRFVSNYWSQMWSDSESSDVEDIEEAHLDELLHAVDEGVTGDHWGDEVCNETIVDGLLPGVTLSRRVSQLNGNNGSWTNTDDVEVKANMVGGKSGSWYGCLHLSFFESALCDCTDKAHVHINDPERITTAHKAFLKRKQKREEKSSPKDADGKKDDKPKNEKKKTENIKFGFTDCAEKGCKLVHLHTVGNSFVLKNSNQICLPVGKLREFGDPVDDEEDIEMKTPLGESMRNEPHVSVAPNNVQTPDEVRGGDVVVVPAGQASVGKFLVSDGVVTYGVCRIGVTQNDGALMINGEMKQNCCFFISMATLLNHLGIDTNPIKLRDDYFPDHQWGSMVELGEEDIGVSGKDHDRLLALLRHYDVTLNVWMEHVTANGGSNGWWRADGYSYGNGRRAVNVAMGVAHFEPIVWFECARLADNGLFRDRRTFRTHKTVRFKSLRSYKARGQPFHEGEVNVGWNITTKDEASTFWVGEPDSGAKNIPLASVTEKMLANGGNPAAVLGENIEEIIASENALRPVIPDDEIPEDLRPKDTIKVVIDPIDSDLLKEGLIITEDDKPALVTNADNPTTPEINRSPTSEHPLSSVESTTNPMHPVVASVPTSVGMEKVCVSTKAQPSGGVGTSKMVHFDITDDEKVSDGVESVNVKGSTNWRLLDQLKRGLNMDVRTEKVAMFTKKDKKVEVKTKPPPYEVSCDDSQGHYLDKARIDDVMMNMSEVICTNASFFQEIEEFVRSFIRKPVAYALPESESGAQHTLKLDMQFASEPTFLWKVLTFNTAKTVKVRKPKSTVGVLEGVYTSSMRAFIWLDLCEALLKDASSIGSLANQDFWTWCVPKYRAKVQALNPEYFSGKLNVIHDVDGHTTHSYNSITCNTICYLIALEAISVGKISLSIPSKIGIVKKGRSTFTANSKVFSVGGVDTFMGVIKANRLISEGVAVNAGVLKQGDNYTIRTTYEPRPSGAYTEGFTRILPMKCTKPMDWEFNGRYKVHKGRRHVVDGKLKFPDDKDEELFDRMNYAHKYISVYGYAFANSGMVYGNHNDNISRMLERHWKKREPEGIEELSLREFGFTTDNFDMKLLAQQSYFANYLATGFIEDTLACYGDLDYFTDVQEAASYLILEKHLKQALRIDSFQDVMNSGEIGQKIFKAYLVWKVKLMEIAKPKKAPRAIVDAQTANSLPNVHISNAWKKHSADKVVVYSDLVSIEFCSCPAPADLEVVFKSWDEYSYDVVVKNYSDDSIIGLWNRDLCRYDMYNTDIRANDGSHSGWTWSVFSNLLQMPSDHSEFLLNMIFTENYVLARNKKDRIGFKSCYGYLPSGIGATSIANNTVMLMISWMLARFIKAGFPLTLSLVTIAAFRCGFLLSFEHFDLSREFSKMQFLKYSPVRISTGEVVVIPNLGRMLRYSGRSKNDVTVKQYQPPLVNGVQVNVFMWYQTLLTYGDFKRVYYQPLVSALCPFFHLVDSRHYDMIAGIDKDRVLSDLHSEVRLFPTREQFYSRYYHYGATDAMIDEFEGLIAHSALGSLIYCPFVDLVLNVDYGLAPICT